ncbi:putative G-protein coupled receptor Mth-like 1 [Folsomia candida]|uniref:Putative G-protein coupled receptor Mth-like 1 n=2 Tax=Folsomia candida TaxID=158441 RepID=A0A226EPG1_FOLCA|nr:putative G-protein coupled receptor Mth-like 1 [Folsomia candida]
MTPRRGANSKGFKRYSFYSVMGWGVPAIIVGTGWTLTKDHPERSCGTILTPGYGVTSCFLQEKALGAYLYYPIAAMIIINLIFFTVTSVKLYVYQNSTKIATKDDTQQQFYRLFFKLFFVMGVFYIFELISWFVSGSGVFWYWAAFDILNILRAVAVFIIFVCKPDILWALEQNYPWLKPILIPCACITRKKRTFSQRRAAESESLGLNTSLSTKQSTLRSSNHVRNINRIMD